jgi:hypothetical protein
MQWPAHEKFKWARTEPAVLLFHANSARCSVIVSGATGVSPVQRGEYSDIPVTHGAIEPHECGHYEPPMKQSRGCRLCGDVNLVWKSDGDLSARFELAAVAGCQPRMNHQLR